MGESESEEDLRAEVANLRQALETRSVIGQALGILMERYYMTAEEAFEFLSELASARERKLRELAEELVRRRELPPGTVPPQR